MACFNKKLRTVGWKSDWQVSSAGTWTTPGIPTTPAVLDVAKKLGLSLEDHRTTSVTAELISKSDLVLVMERNHKEALQNEFPEARDRIFLFAEVVDTRAYEVPDPAGGSPESYEQVSRQLSEMVERGFYKVCTQALRLRKKSH